MRRLRPRNDQNPLDDQLEEEFDEYLRKLSEALDDADLLDEEDDEEDDGDEDEDEDEDSMGMKGDCMKHMKDAFGKMRRMKGDMKMKGSCMSDMKKAMGAYMKERKMASKNTRHGKKKG